MQFPSKLMVCVEDAESFQTYKEELGWVARHLECGVVLYHAMRPTFESSPAHKSLEEQIAEGIVALADDPALHGVEVEIRCVETPADLTDAIIEAAQQSGADTLIVPTHGRSGLDRMLFGSVAERVIRSCKLPVLTFDLNRVPRRRDEAAFDQVVVPIDFSEISEAAIPVALNLARRVGCAVTLFHAVEDYYTTAYPMGGFPAAAEYVPTLLATAREHAERVAARFQADDGPKIETVTEIGRLTELARDVADRWKNPLFVMATAGRDSIGDYILGSRAERLIRTAHCSALTMPKVFLQNLGREES